MENEIPFDERRDVLQGSTPDNLKNNARSNITNRINKAKSAIIGSDKQHLELSIYLDNTIKTKNGFSYFPELGQPYPIKWEF